MTARGPSTPGALFGSPSEMLATWLDAGDALMCVKVQLSQLSRLAPTAFAGHAGQKAPLAAL